MSNHTSKPPTVLWLQRIGWAEGVSFLVLLGVAMPLKYLAHKPMAVTVVGMLHGILFVAFGVALLAAWLEMRWKFSRVFKIFLSALVPFGPFLMDRLLHTERPNMEKS